jgi:colanic acid biosynthesis protein WcaH
MTAQDSLAASIEALRSHISDPHVGLPEPVFLFISAITPLVTVDLLIKDDRGRTLLTWRNDACYGPGWHLPGGVVRFQERTADRIRAVARQELEVEVECDPEPFGVHELIDTGCRERGHAIALLYRCRLLTPLSETRCAVSPVPLPDQWAWHENCPDDLIPEHAVYRWYFRG